MFVLLFFVAVAAAWIFTRPRHVESTHSQGVTVAQTAAPAATAPAEAAATPEATTTPEAVVSPMAAASAVSTPAFTPSAPPHSGAKLALIIDDCGQWVATERKFIALPVPLTMSVLPHVAYGSTISQEARSAGKGVMLHLPMETVSGMDPGPGKVTTAMTDAQITAQVEDDLAQVPLAEGVNNHEGSKASADKRVMDDVISVIAKHGNLFWIDSRTSAASVGEEVASSSSVPTAGRDVFLDNEASVAYSEAQLREAAALAKKNGSAIAIGHPKPTTLAAVEALLPELQDEGIEFVLVSNLTH